MIREIDHLNEIECQHLAGKFGLTEMQDIVAGKEPTTKHGELVVHKIQQGLVSMESFKNLVTHIEECSTNNLMEQWG